MSIEIQGLSKHQVKLADMLWKANTMDEVNGIIQQYGVDAVVVRDMIIAASLDEDFDTKIAEIALKEFTL